jgi:type IX secretion system PorP/SprF family membrane protein
MDKNNNIDDLFKSKLDSYQPEYVHEHWQMLKNAMESSPKVVPVIYGNFTAKLLIVLSAIIIVGSGIYTYLLTQEVSSLKIKEKTLSQYKATVKTPDVNINNRDRNSPVVNSNISPVEKKNAPKNTTNIVKENNSTFSSVSNNRNYQKDNIQVHNSTLQTNFKKSINLSLNNENTVEKTLVNDGEFAVLSGKDIIENDFTLKNDNVTENLVSENGIQQNISVNTIINEQIDKNETNNIAENSNIEDDNYTSVTDDYLAQKQKLDKKYKKAAERKLYNSKSYESLPDCKVSMVNNFVINPAYAGFNQRHTISLSSLVHKPFYKLSNDFNVPLEYSIAYDFNFGKRKNCGIGLNYKRYLGAAEGSLAVDLTFAYRIFLAQHHNLRLGFSASYLVSDINKEHLSFSDMIDSIDGFVYNTNEMFPDKTASNNFDLGMGVWYNWKTLFVGISAVHLTSPEIGVISKSRIPREYLLSAGYGFNINKKLSTLPALELKYNEKLLYISPSMLFTYKRWLLFGMEFQNLRNAGLVLGFNLNNNFIINMHGGIPLNMDIIENFGIVDYAKISLRFQLGNYR